MQNYFKYLLILAAPVGFGMAMPSCPGQQEMKQQIETLQNANADLTKKVQTLTNQVHSLNTDIGQIKNLLPQITNVISGQKGALDKIEADVKAIQAKMTATKGRKR